MIETTEIVGKGKKEKTIININQKIIVRELKESRITEIGLGMTKTLLEIPMLKRIVPKMKERVITETEGIWPGTTMKDPLMITIHQRKEKKEKNLPIEMKTVIRKISLNLILMHRVFQ